MVRSWKERGEDFVDDVMTLRGRIAPRARDVAFIASIPEVSRKIVEYRLKYFLCND